MKFITLFETQCSLNSNYLYDTLMKNVEATDFVFVPKAYGSANKNTQITALNKILSIKSSAKLWIGTPGITSANYTSLPSLTTMKNFINDVYNGLSNKNAVAGIYYNQESIYGSMTYSTNIVSGTQPGNKQVKLMSDVKSSLNAIIGTNQMLWIPYYGYGSNAATIIKNIGYVADTTTIFKYVCLQPHYLFEPDLSPNNLLGVQYSVKNNKICYRDGVAVISSPISGKPTIGFEMEYTPESGYSSRYQEYVNTFNSYKSKPHGFYWQTSSATSNEFTTIMNTINAFL